jgi:fumarate hydratase subunit alpha
MEKRMRNIECREIVSTVSSIFQSACIHLPPDLVAALNKAAHEEKSPTGRRALNDIISNIRVAAETNLPVCQDTGTAVVFLELGQDVHIVGGNLNEAVNEGVRQAYEDGYLRKSMVYNPFSTRINTGENTPAVVHTEMVAGDHLKISALPKGGGAENCSRLTVLAPSKGRSGIFDFAVNLVSECGCNACPPLIVGIGIGGTTEKAMLISKKSLLRKIGDHHPDHDVQELEKDLLREINNLGIGPMGYGGTVTALAVHVETFAAHIASLPVAVNLQCWCSRHREAII